MAEPVHPDIKTCPDCLADIPRAATFCRHCGERVEGRPCVACGVRNWDLASICRCCGTACERQAREAPAFSPFTVTAGPLPTLLVRGRLIPQTIEVSREKIVIRTPGAFNLRRREEEIPWRKVAGFDYHSGIIWDRVTIETRGQSSSRIECLSKPDGRRIRAVLQALEI